MDTDKAIEDEIARIEAELVALKKERRNAIMYFGAFAVVCLAGIAFSMWLMVSGSC